MAATLTSDNATRVTVPAGAHAAEVAGSGGVPSSPSRRVEIVVWLALCALAAALLAGHSMWFDELQAWNIARASHSLGDLWTNLRHEGHPVLWYLPLYAITRVTGDPRGMQVLEWLVLCATYAVIVFRAPFPLLGRVGLAAGYFVTFEYGVISRAYGIGLLLTLVALDALHRDEPKRARATVALALLPWTSLAGAVLALALAGAALWSTGRRALTPALVVAGSAAVAVYTCRPAVDFVSFSTGIPTHPLSLSSFTGDRIAGALAGPWRGLVPIPSSSGGWNTNVLDGVGSVWFAALLGAVLVGGVAYVLRRHAVALRTWLLGVAGYLVFSVVVVLPDRSHYAGVFFVLFVACTWLAWPRRDAPRPTAPERELRIAFTAVVAIGVLTLLAVALPRTSGAFAPDESLAATARAIGAADVVVSAHDFHGVAIAGFLDRPVYSVARGEWIRFFPNDRREQRGNDRMTDAVIRCTAAQVAQRRNRTVVLVTDRRLTVPAGWRTLADDQGVRLYAVPASAAGEEAACVAS